MKYLANSIAPDFKTQRSKGKLRSRERQTLRKPVPLESVFSLLFTGMVEVTTTAGETETGTGPSVSVGPRARTPGEPEEARERPRELTETPRPYTTSDVILQGKRFPSLPLQKEASLRFDRKLCALKKTHLVTSPAIM